MGIQELQGQERGIAIIRMVRSSEYHFQSEVAITVIDEYQRMGLGTLLLRLLSLAAIERSIHELSFTFMPTNSGIYKLIHEVGRPIQGSINHDSIQLILDVQKMNLKEIKSQLVKNLPMIENFHLET